MYLKFISGKSLKENCILNKIIQIKTKKYTVNKPPIISPMMI